MSVALGSMHVQYERNMRGVDSTDQLRGNYSTLMKSHKWWHRLFHFYWTLQLWTRGSFTMISVFNLRRILCLIWSFGWTWRKILHQSGLTKTRDFQNLLQNFPVHMEFCQWSPRGGSVGFVNVVFRLCVPDMETLTCALVLVIGKYIGFRRA